jgi:Cu2+-containing amine oxidase
VGEETVLVSELQAGWYRYLSQWRLHADGTIRPRFGFAAVDDSCTCDTHHHHVYWRFDFDVVNGAHNAVREFNDPPVAGSERWHTLRHEIRRRRSLNRKRRWRVVNRVSGESYNLRPGPDDGTADDFGVGDMWALRRRGGQIDDGPGGARARIDRFVNGESIFDTDVVLWYAAHFSHESHAETDDEHEHDHAHGHIVGPDLWPRGW